MPLFFLCYSLGILDSYGALVLPNLISPTSVFLMYQFFRTIPDDLIHAARIDGMSYWSIVWRVVVPLSRPVLAAIAVLSLIGRWNDLYWPAIAVTSTELMPPPLGILVFSDEEAGTSYGPLMAAATITTAPLIVAFLLAQRRFIDSFTAAEWRRDDTADIRSLRRQACYHTRQALPVGRPPGSDVRARRDSRTLRVAYGVATFSKLYEAVAEAFMRAHPGLQRQAVARERTPPARCRATSRWRWSTTNRMSRTSG